MNSSSPAAGSSSEEVIGAAIAAANPPCLIYNTAAVAVAQFQKQGGLVNLSTLPGGAKYIESRHRPGRPRTERLVH